MAVAYETSLAPITVTFDAAGEFETHAFDAGSGANRALIVFVSWRDRSNTITSITYAGAALTSLGAQETNGVITGQIWGRADPASGSNNIVVTMGAGSGTSSAQIGAWVANGTDIAGTTFDGFQGDNGTASTANIVSAPGAVTSAVDDMVATFHATLNGSGNIAVTTSTGYTERQDAATGGGFSQQFGDAAGAASVTTSATWDNGAFAVNWIAFAVNVNATGGGGGTAVPVFVNNLRVQGIL